jgi:predicted DNA-binding transcriptional regulator AlpA
MSSFSTRQVAKKLGLPPATLARYVAASKVPAPKPIRIGNAEVRAWSEKDIERVQEILPKIVNGRKTRHQKRKRQKTKQDRRRPSN